MSATPQVGYLKPNYLPPYRKLWSPPSNAYVCYLHLTQTDCEYPGYGQAELPDGMWPCHWNASVAQPMRPCVSMVSSIRRSVPYPVWSQNRAIMPAAGDRG